MPNPSPDIGTIRQQIGEILGTVRAVSEAMADQKNTQQRHEDRVESELRNLKHDQRNKDTVVSGRLEILSGQIQLLDTSTKAVSTELNTVKENIQELRKLEAPINSILAVRKKLIGYVLLFFSLVTMVWYALLPIFHIIAESAIKAWFGVKGG